MNEPLPLVPVPAPPVDPPCDWCGQRPAAIYEVAPAVFGIKVGHDTAGRQRSAKVVTKHAIEAYACGRHRELFDKQKQEIADRKERERREIKEGV